MLTLIKLHKQIPDAQLIANYKNLRDDYSIETLFYRYSHLVFLTCQKYLRNEEDSKDAVMEIFEKLIVDLEKYDIDNFSSWLHVVAKNHCISKLRKPAFRDTVVKKNEEFEKISVENPGFVRHNNKRENYNLDAALNQLNEKQRICIELFYLKKKGYKEIEQTTDFKINEIKSHIQNGKKNLKKILTEGKE